MTPEDWFAANDPAPLLVFVRGDGWSAAYARRPELFVRACAFMVWDLIPTDSRSSVLMRERYADGLATETDLLATGLRVTVGAVNIRQFVDRAIAGDPFESSLGAARAIATCAAGPPSSGGPSALEWQATWNAAFAAARVTQADIVRDIFPPPGYTPELDPEWLTSTVVAIARQMDEFGDFSAVPILADALEDAGCDTETVLQCCRAPGNVHVRGNWVVDLILASSKVTVP